MSESDFPSSSDTRSFSSAQAVHHEPFGDRRETPASTPGRPAREGLPPSYRMRADAHYVDQLSGRSSTQTIHLLKVSSLTTSRGGGAAAPPDALVASIRRHNVLQPLLVQRHSGRYRVIDGQKRLAAAMAAGMDEVPCLLHDIEDGEAAALSEAANVPAPREQPATAACAPLPPALVEDMAESLGAAAGAANLLSRSSGSLARLAALNLINAEMWRAECLIDSSRVLDGRRRVARVAAYPSRIVEAVARQMTAEARLRAAQVEVRTIDLPAAAQVHSDEQLIVKCLSLLAVSTLIWIESVPEPRITIRAALRGSRSAAFEVFQDSIAVPSVWLSGLSSASEHTVGAVPAAVWVLGARRIAEALGGQIAIAPAGAVGTIMGLTLPIARE